mgnify:CR=1 FL=1
MINSDINIAEGELGLSIPGLSEDQKQAAFIRLFNRILTGVSAGEGAYIEDPLSFVRLRRRVVDVEFQSFLFRQNILTSTGGTNIIGVRENLWGTQEDVRD